MSTTSTQGVIACNTILPVLGIVVVGLRFYIRASQNINLKFDDLLQLPALIIFIGMAITALYGVKHRAFGYPTPLRPPTEPAESLILCEKLWFAIQLMQISALTIIKIAALCFYRRIFVTSTRNSMLNIIIWTLIAATAVWGLAFTGFYVGVCGAHFSAAWSGFIGFSQYCIQTLKFEKGYAISDFILDTFVLAVPLPSIWSLQMKVARKIGITAVFMFALIGYGASIARLVNFVNSSDNASHGLPDVQSSDTQAVWYSALETGFAIFALNLPAIWPVVAKFPIESIIRSVRSLVSLRSKSSKNRSYNEINGYTERGVAESNDNENIELVPQNRYAHYRAKTKSGIGKTLTSHVQPGRDVERGIHVQKSVNISETRDARSSL